jgi:hypothetical protein
LAAGLAPFFGAAALGAGAAGAFLAGTLAAGLAALAVANLFLLNSEAVGAVVFFAVAIGYLPFVAD